MSNPYQEPYQYHDPANNTSDGVDEMPDPEFELNDLSNHNSEDWNR